MATKKAYTDLEQSRKLAEILPLESADMRYGYIALYDYSDRMYDGGYDEIPYPKDFLIKNPNFSANEYDAELPCWSLVALLSALPRIEHLKPFIDLSPELDSDKVAIYYHSENSPYIVRDNLIDACVEMIFKLHEQNLLQWDSK